MTIALEWNDSLFLLIIIHLANSYPIFSELYQFSPIGTIGAIIPNITETESSMAMLKKGAGRLLCHNFPTPGFDIGFVHWFLSQAFGCQLHHEGTQCNKNMTARLLTHMQEEGKNQLCKFFEISLVWQHSMLISSLYLGLHFLPSWQALPPRVSPPLAQHCTWK